MGLEPGKWEDFSEIIKKCPFRFIGPKRAVLYSRHDFNENPNWYELSNDLKRIPMNINGCFTNPNEIFSFYIKLKSEDVNTKTQMVNK